jgi:hypothetical protein
MQCIAAQDKLLGKIMAKGNFFENIQQDTFYHTLDSLINDYHQEVQQLEFE